MSFKYILFDMDGVLVDSERVSYGIWKNFFSHYDTELSLDGYIQMCGRSNDDMPPYVRENYPRVDSGALPGYWENEFGRVVDSGRLPVKKGVYALFDAMDEKKARRAVASSNIRFWVEKNLRAARLLDRIEAIACDGDVAACKPAPDLFLKGAQLLGARPQDCLVVEDSVSGILAGKAAGCAVALIPDLRMPPDDICARCDYVVDDLTRIIPLL
ncbi:MAG: HAD family phosphatase [Oscillospiraceae bacterium]|nr:HAD family phosphatase [Oscillospiraceae bacterium]